jgi:hypothetical protein
MSSEKLYSEIFEDFDKATTKEERIAVLRKNFHPRFAEFLQMAFHPNIIFDVRIPNYRPAQEPAGLNFTYIDNEISKLYRFVKGHPKRPPEMTTDASVTSGLALFPLTTSITRVETVPKSTVTGLIWAVLEVSGFEIPSALGLSVTSWGPDPRNSTSTVALPA